MLNGSRERYTILGLLLCLGWFGTSHVWAADPFASNNGLYPTKADWSGPYAVSNYDFPTTAKAEWLERAPRDRLTTANAGAYVDALKKFVEPTLEAMIDTPESWDPHAAKWFSMPWTASLEGNDATSGREALLGSFSGQVIQGRSFDLVRSAAAKAPLIYPFATLKKDFQNHTVIYYDEVAATMLRKVWNDPFHPNARLASFPEGSLVVKAGAVTATPDTWDVVTGSAIWHVFRPPFTPVGEPPPAIPSSPLVTELRMLQFDVIVKDTRVAPDTGWVFITWVYDKDAPGRRPWDRLIPLGAMWGNDPTFARNPNGRDPSKRPLQETWINPRAPEYATKTLGWGGRLSGPIDVALRHGVVITDGSSADSDLRASSCLSCHGTSQYPFIANLYPSPNKIFPQDGKTFLLYPPGSVQWAQWFQNRSGAEAQSKELDANAVGLDYDMLLTFALSNFNEAAGQPALAIPQFRVH